VNPPEVNNVHIRQVGHMAHLVAKPASNAVQHPGFTTHGAIVPFVDVDGKICCQGCGPGCQGCSESSHRGKGNVGKAIHVSLQLASLCCVVDGQSSDMLLSAQRVERPPA